MLIKANGLLKSFITSNIYTNEIKRTKKPRKIKRGNSLKQTQFDEYIFCIVGTRCRFTLFYWISKLS